ncbi:hypothetical protein [Natronorubrum thiooxidans]
MGISTIPVDPLVANANDLSEVDGVLVTDIDDDGPTSDILQCSADTVERRGESVPVGGDVIVELDGDPIPDRNAFTAFWRSRPAPTRRFPSESVVMGPPIPSV